MLKVKCVIFFLRHSVVAVIVWNCVETSLLTERRELHLIVTAWWRVFAEFTVSRVSGHRWCHCHTGIFCVRWTLMPLSHWHLLCMLNTHASVTLASFVYVEHSCLCHTGIFCVRWTLIPLSHLHVFCLCMFCGKLYYHSLTDLHYSIVVMGSCALRGWMNRSTAFPCQMSWKESKPWARQVTKRFSEAPQRLVT